MSISNRAWCVVRLRASCVVLALVLGAPTGRAQTQLVIVSGIGGDPKYTQTFAQLSTALAQAAHERTGLSDSAIVWLGEATAPRSRWYRGTSTRDNIERVLSRLAERPDAGEQLVLVLIGHGSGEGPETRLSLPGADLTARDFAVILSRFGNRRVAFINLTSASGDMLPVVAAPNRVVMTATKSAFERNESQFARFFVDALSRDGADTDKDNRVSLLEAFKYAESETKRFYESDGRLATEHAQIADGGELARRFFLTGGATAKSGASSRLNALYAERFALDEQIQTLKSRKAALTADAYDAELERLLLALAEKAREIKQLERGS
jgi:hypothetical protein